MKIKRHDLSGFSDLGTAVFYWARPFYPEVLGYVPEIINDVVRDMWGQDFISLFCRSFNYLHSTEGGSSEYIDFSKYNFKFDLPKSDYWSTLRSNLFDYTGTKNIFGEGFDKYSENIIPQLSGKTTEAEEKHFFSKLSSSDDTIFLLGIPHNINNLILPEDSKFGLGDYSSLNPLEGFWKVEIYNSRLTTNNTLYSGFVDYDILELMDQEYTIEKPLLSVYFGPSWDLQIEDKTLGEAFSVSGYCDRFKNRLLDNDIYGCLSGDDDKYSKFTTYISEGDYLKSISEELLSDKILYIINSTNDGLSTVDFFTAALPKSKEKYRNQSQNLLRNDYTQGDSVIETSGSLVLDSRAEVVLGTRSSECPLLTSRISRLSRDLYSKSSDTGETLANGRTYLHGGQDVLGENPEISPFWISKSDIPKSMFSHYYILKEGHGVTYPQGIVYKREDKDLKISVSPNKGYIFSGIKERPNGEYQGKSSVTIDAEDGETLTFVFNEITYTLDLRMVCNHDYPKYGVSTQYAVSGLGGIKIKFLYYDYDSEDYVEYSGGVINVTYTRPLIFKVVPEDDSLYKLSSNIYFFRDDANTKLAADSENYITLSIEDTSDTILGASTSLVVIGGIESKTYDVLVETTSEVQVSTAKKTTLEYGGGYISYFTLGDSDDLKVDNVKVYNVDTAEYEESGVWQLTEKDGVVEFYYPARTQEHPEYGVIHNYEIRITP